MFGICHEDFENSTEILYIGEKWLNHDSFDLLSSTRYQVQVDIYMMSKLKTIWKLHQIFKCPCTHSARLGRNADCSNENTTIGKDRGWDLSYKSTSYFGTLFSDIRSCDGAYRLIPWQEAAFFDCALFSLQQGVSSRLWLRENPLYQPRRNETWGPESSEVQRQIRRGIHTSHTWKLHSNLVGGALTLNSAEVL